MPGFLARITGGLLRPRTLQAGSGITITNPAGDAGDPTIAAIAGGSGINQLTGDVLAGPGTGSQVATAGPNIPLLNAANVFSADQSVSKTRPRVILTNTGQTPLTRLHRGGSVDSVFSHNLDYDGVNWNSDDATLASTVISMNASAMSFYLNTAGANPRTAAFILAMQILATGTVSLVSGQLAFPSAQLPSTNANTLDDYEEGTWTPNDASGAGLAFTSPFGSYVKIGQKVTAAFFLAYPNTANGNNAIIGNLPFTVETFGGVQLWGGAFTFTSKATLDTLLCQSAGTGIIITAPGGVAATNASYSLKTVSGVVNYRASA